MGILARVVRGLDSLGAAAAIGGRTVLGVDTNRVPADWTHITKVDPEVGKRLPLAYPLYLQHTSAVEVGGSRDVTGETTEETLRLVADRPVPAFQEPSAARHVTEETRERAAFLAIPEVVNGDAAAMVGTLGEGIEYVKTELGPQLIDRKLPVPLGALEDRLANFAASWMLREEVFEAYIIMNLDSAAAREGNVTEEGLLSPAEARQRALAVEHYLESEIIYLEYSGRFGGEEAVDLLEAIDDAVSAPRIWYGGGLDSRENAEAVLEAGADSVVVGNVFHEIAEEEREHCRAAAADLAADADEAAVEDWVAANVDVPESSAARYLSTIPGVARPDRLAEEYLVTTLQLYLETRALADEVVDASSLSDVEAVLDDRPAAPGATALAGVVEPAFQRRLVRALLAAHAGLEPDLPVSHLAVEF
jgi:phosphoglycerol geranylgeranyltransferase